MASNPLPDASPLLLLGLPRRKAAVDVLLLLLLGWVAIEFDSWYGGYAPAEWTFDPVQSLLVPRAILAGVIVLVGWVLCRLEQLPPSACGLRRERIESQVLWGIAGAVMAYLPLVLLLVVYYFHLRHGGRSAPMAPLARIAHGPTSMGAVLVMVLAAAITEEAFFRALLLPRLRRVTGTWWTAILLTAALFSWTHLPGGWVYAAGAFFIFIVWSAVFVRSGSLLAALLAHFLFNMCQFAMNRMSYGG
jgi:membrane protease YdiL (CAAX protease family)